MITVKVSTLFPEWPFLRQTPGSIGIWGECRFIVDGDVGECDYWVVYGGLTKEEKTLCPLENTILIAGEPPTFRSYNTDFLNQFAIVITCRRTMNHPNVVIRQQGLPWHVGREEVMGKNRTFTKCYDELKSIKSFKKDKVISCIASDKDFSEGHRQRIEFVKKLRETMGSQIDIFGRGLREIPDKWDAIAGYKYHLAIENSAVEDYWTEKLSDAFLGGAYPIYYGCPNIADYFPPDAMTVIDIGDFEKSISVVKKVLESKTYEKSLESINQARDVVLDKYNFFAMMAEFCSGREASGRKAEVCLRPEASMAKGRLARLADRMRRGLNSISGGTS